MTFTMVLLAINGAAAHVVSTEGIWPKARTAALMAYLFTKEIVGFAAFIPSVSRSVLIYCSLPSHPPQLTATATANSSEAAHPHIRLRKSFLRPHRRWFDHFSVSVVRNISYGNAKRNLLDVYVPGEAASEGRRWPVVMFVHGGIWASGNKEVFSHVGACLANLGILTAVVQYTLFPEVLAWQQVREVSRALTWVLDNAMHYGGDPERVTLMGHSAGAHLASLVMWERLKAGQQLCQRKSVAGPPTAICWPPSGEIKEEDFGEEDVRQPCNFVGLAGVYDIVEHLKYERKRGVDTMSCMTPAMGGKHFLNLMSPTRLFYSLRGVGISDNLKYTGEHVRNGDSEADSIIQDSILSNGNGGSDMASNGHVRNYCDGCELFFPRCTIISSQCDTTVPPDTSIQFHAVLREHLHLQAELVLMGTIRHGDFIVFDGQTSELVALRNHILNVVVQPSQLTRCENTC